MTPEALLLRFAHVIHTDARHVHYQRTVAIADLCRTLYTGEGMDALLRQFVKREDTESFKQRVQITEHVVSATVRNIMDVFAKVPRANYQRVLTYAADEMEGKTVELEHTLSGFWGEFSLDNWMATRWREMNATDPNAFVVVEFAAFDNNKETATPYPFEVSSRDAVDYRYDNNILQYLICKQTSKQVGKNGIEREVFRFTLYAPDFTVIAQELHPDFAPMLYGGMSAGTGADIETFETETGKFLRTNQRVFQVIEPVPHQAGRVPAKRIGYVRDLSTNGNTFVAPYDAAIPLLKKTIKINSELDLTMALQAHPRIIEYAQACDAEGCYEGYNNVKNEVCGTCHGTGVKTASSAQEKIVVKMPSRKEDMLDLSNMVAFAAPPVTIVQFMADYVDELTRKAKATVFNTDIFSQKQIAETATGKNIDLQNVYDTLFDCAIGFARTWEWLVWMVAKFTGKADGLVNRLIFSKDFKLKGLVDLLAELESANRSESGPAVKRHIQQDIARIMYADNPEEYTRWSVRERHNPFSGHSEAFVLAAMASDVVSQKTKILYANFGAIFDEAEQAAASQSKDFYKMPYADQKTIINNLIATHMADMEQGAARPIFERG